MDNNNGSFNHEQKSEAVRCVDSSIVKTKATLEYYNKKQRMKTFRRGNRTQVNTPELIQHWGEVIAYYEAVLNDLQGIRDAAVKLVPNDTVPYPSKTY